MAIEIPLTKGKVTVIDDEDYELVSKYKWYFNGKGYAVNRSFFDEGGKRATLIMHRMILNAPPELLVDHIDGNTLNNQKSNLRLVTRSQNCWNMKKHITNSSGYKGVTKCWNRWSVSIGHKGEKLHVGIFKCKHAAALAYNAKAIELFGEYARLNVISMSNET